MIHIAFCTDTNYVMPTGVAMVSICENNLDENIIFHLVITDEGKEIGEVEKKVSPLRDIASKYGQSSMIYRMDEEKIKQFVCTGAGHVSVSAFSRIFLPEILSKDIDKVLYLDCDLVCNGSLKDLWETELEKDCPIGAVVDCFYSSPNHHLTAKIPQSIHYVNSGVLLMNLDCWRKNNYVELAVNTAIENKFPLLDQDTINHIFCGKIKYLPVKYNYSIVIQLVGIERCLVTLDFYDEMISAQDAPIIIHYQSQNKPWKNELCPMREVWDKYLKLTIWKNYKPTPVFTQFNWTNIYHEFDETYWMDAILFNIGLSPYLRFFRAAVKLKNKNWFVKISSLILNAFAWVLEKIYNLKTRK